MANVPKSPWRAVSVVAGPAAFAAAQRLRGQRFLTGKAPRLPLAACNNQDQCGCKYQHHPDRRGDTRRTDDEGATTVVKPRGSERRRPGERRERRR